MTLQRVCGLSVRTDWSAMNPELAQVLRELEESTARMLSALSRPILLESKLEKAVSGGDGGAVVDGPELS